MVRKVLKSDDFKDDDRIQLAASVPFHSMQMGRDGGTDSITRLQGALIELELFNNLLPPKHRPVGPLGASGPPSAGWGPFEVEGFERQQQQFGFTTQLAIQRFQRQAGMRGSDVDGKAGIQTLKRLDEITTFIDANF